MNVEQLKSLIDATNGLETTTVEFKVNNANPEEVGKKVSSLLNAAILEDQERAYLIYGVDDGGKIVGTNLDLNHPIGNEPFEQWLYQSFLPKPHIEHHNLSIDGKRVVVFEIHASLRSPLAFRNIRYIRVGSATHKLNDCQEKEEIIWKKINSKSFEEGIAQSNLTNEEVLAKIDFTAYFDQLNQPIPSNSAGIIERLESDGIVVQKNGQNSITNLGAILLAKDLNNFSSVSRKMIRVIIYKDNSKISIEREYEIKSGYFKGFQEAMQWIIGHLPANEELKMALRKEYTKYPVDAIRELLGNAIIHQDLSMTGVGPIVELYENSLEIKNPGQPLISEVDRLFNYSRSRNEKMAKLARKLGMCEERGSGLRRVLKMLDIFQLPPLKISTQDDFTQVILSSYKHFNHMTVQEKIYACYQHCVLKYLDERQSMANSSLRDRFQLKKTDHSAISKIIAATLETGLIKRENPHNISKKFVKYIPYWA